MSKKIFTEKEIKILSRNPYVKSVSSKGISYTDEFKRVFIEEDEREKFPRQIFTEHGIDIEINSIERVEGSAKRWRGAYRKRGINGLQDARKGISGRSSEKELTLEEKYARLESQNHLLKAENELLKKLEMMERGLRKKK